jgi:transketolase
MRPPIRLAALSGLQVVHVFTHDSIAQGWQRWVGDAGAVVSVERFGASAPAKTLLREYGFTVEAVCAKAREVLAALKRS